MRHLMKLAMVLGFVALSSHAYALGLGGYLQFEGGSGSIEADVPDSSSEDITSSAWGIGFTLDTNPMTSELWSYRLNLGYQGASIDSDEAESESQDFAGFVLDNTFAFTISSDKMMRIWAGPVIRLASYSSDEDGADTTLGMFGIGAAVGLNYQVADKFIVSPSLVVVYNGVSGEVDPDVGDKVDLDGSLFTYGLKVDCLYDL